MKFILLLIVVCFYTKVSSQEPNIKSPQVYEMERYGNVPVNLSVGSIDLNIPLFNQNQYSINLYYNSSGFIPTKKSNFVGLNWGLNYGGVITRETIDQDDDSSVEGGGGNIKGFLYYVKNRKSTDEKLYNDKIQTGYLNVNGYYTELTSDRYNFNFMGIKGYFKINSNGEAITYSTDPNIKIDISKLSYQYYYSCSPELSEITITDGKGNKYIFGGHYDSIEVSYNLGLFNSPHAYPTTLTFDGTKTYSVKSWMLTKVIFNNNRELLIKYKRYDKNINNFCRTINSIPSKYHIDYNFFDLNFIVHQDIYRGNYNFNYSNGGEHIWGKGSSFGWTAPYHQINLVKKAIPEQIIIDNNTVINFNYSTLTSVSNFKNDIITLDNIKIFHKNNQYDEIKFDYTRNRDYIFLNTLNIGSKKYIFDYYNINNLPPSNTFAIDHWGYWNGRDDYQNALIPKYSFNSNTGEYKILGSDRDANPELAKVSLLSKVIYPTGGVSNFEYEGHDYSMKIIRTPSTDFIRSLNSEYGIIGGARIKKITNIDVNNISDVREFKYIDNNSTSSGIALDDIRYLYYNDYKKLGGRERQVFEKNINYFSNSLSSSPIEYGRVLEYKNNFLYKEHIFSTYKTNPDSLSYVIKYEYPDYDFKPKNMNRNLELKYLDFSNRRRLPLKENYFDESGKIVKEIGYQYTFPRKEQDKFINSIFRKEHTVSVSAPIYGSYYYIDYYNYPLLRRKVEKYFFDNNIINSSEEYIYGDNKTLNLQKKYSFLSDKITKIITHEYAKEKGNQYLIDKNMVGIPLETTTSKDGKMISKIETKYPISQQEANTKTNGLPLPISVISNDLNSNQSITNITYTKYDDRGNLLEYKIDDILPVAIVYGYNQSLPIAKIEGATYAQIQYIASDIIQKSNIGTEQELLESLSRFRTDNRLNNFQITTYTHKPLIGVSSITPPTGITEFYRYDSANRLEKVIDANNKVIKTYKYHYMPRKYYSNQESKVFRRNNCGISAIGTKYTYIVPANKYNSFSSQYDVDKQVKEDIDKNGQKMANTIGKCIPIKCEFVPNYYSVLGKISSSFDNYKLELLFSQVNTSNNSHTDILVGNISDECRPYKDYSSYNGRIYYTIKSDGNVLIKMPIGFGINSNDNYILHYPIDK